MPNEHPQRRVLERGAQRPEDLVARVRAVALRQLLERLRLRVCEERPQVVFSDDVLGIGDLRLLKHAVLVLADQEPSDVLLERQLGRPSLSHGLALSSRPRQ